MNRAPMKLPLDFYFDFSSPYGYLASSKIDALAARHQRTVAWRPILLGAVFKITGQQPLSTIPVKGPYAQRDFERSARYFGAPFRMPSKFPIGTTAPARAFYAVVDSDPATAKRLAAALYGAYFADDRDISSPDVTVQVAESIGLDAGRIAQALNDAAVKDRLRREVDAAIACGVFGSPYIVVDGEPFWGSDRLDQIDQWLASGGW